MGKKSVKAVSPLNGQPVPGGRPKGVLNKTTVQFKEAINNLIEMASPKFIEWLELVAKDDPAKALDLIAKLAEYAYPKLSRQTVVGDKDAPIEINTSFVDPQEAAKAYMDAVKKT